MSLKQYIFILLFSVISYFSFSQATCASPYNLGTIGSSNACVNFASNGTTGSAPCAGSGYGGSGGVTYVRFCTGATVSCINFNLTNGGSLGNFAVTVYSANCTTLMDAQCLGNNGSGATFNTAAPIYNAYQPNSCYIARIWTGNTGGFSLCAQAMAPANDYCSNPTQISPVSQALNNFCMTAGSNGSYVEPTAAQFCAGSLENNAWYSVTTLSNCSFPCTVTVTIAGITCSGGGAGFQIGYWTGACSSLTNIGCTSGTGGTVTATITNLNPNQTVLIGIDGNAGANCTYSMSATNTIPLPIEMYRFELTKNTNYVSVNWSTASEHKNDYFTIEKTKDGSVFETVGIIKGAGTSQQANDYTYKDIHPLKGISYYRLKQTDYDGNFTYSQMRAIEYSGDLNPGFNIIPNPSDNFSSAQLIFTDLKDRYVDIIVADVSGKIIYNSKVHGNDNFTLPQFGAGYYFVSVKNDEFDMVKPMIIH
jgi:hypothetical protein